MKYIIVGKDEVDGTSTNDYPNPLVITEIATELVITRLGLFDFMSRGDVSFDDTIVTIEDRKCLYTNRFKNVMTWRDFKQTQISVNDEVIDMLNNDLFMTLCQGYKRQPNNPISLPYKPFYKHFDRDSELITNFERSDLTKYNLSEPFVALVIRTRGAWTEKNMTREFWNELIDKFKQEGVKMVVFGKETEEYCDEDIQYIETYQDWCSVVEHTNCKHIISTMTGGVYPAMIFGNPEIKLTIIDNTLLMDEHGGDPSFYDDCVNFSKVEFNFINYIPKIEELYDRVK